MKKLLFLLILTLSLFGCEMYEQPSDIKLNINGEWEIAAIQPRWSEGDIKILDASFFAQSPFTIVSVDGNGYMIVKNNIIDLQPCFIYKTGWVWSFDYYTLIIKDNTGNPLNEYYVEFENSPYNSGDFKLRDKYTMQEIPGMWHITPLDAFGVNPSHDMIISVPDIFFNFESSGRSFERQIQQSITLIFTR